MNVITTYVQVVKAVLQPSKGESEQGHLNGIRERWLCKQCSSDFCFQCHSKNVVRSNIIIKIFFPSE